MGRVSIGTCAGPADAALVKAAFEAHRIPVLINAEQHASMLAGLGGAFVPLHIFVDSEHAEEAAELLADLRAREASAEPEPSQDEDEDDRELAAEAVSRARRRSRNGILLLIVLGGAAATPYVIGDPLLSVVLVVACLGAMFVTIRQSRGPELPRARIRR